MHSPRSFLIIFQSVWTTLSQLFLSIVHFLCSAFWRRFITKPKQTLPMAIIDTVFKYSNASFNANFIQLCGFLTNGKTIFFAMQTMTTMLDFDSIWQTAFRYIAFQNCIEMAFISVNKQKPFFIFMCINIYLQVDGTNFS